MINADASRVRIDGYRVGVLGASGRTQPQRADAAAISCEAMCASIYGEGANVDLRVPDPPVMSRLTGVR